MRQASIPVLAAVLLAAPAFAQTTWHVDDDACPGPGAGTADDPFCSIQDGIDASADGDTVLVQPGSYDPIDFDGKAITVQSTDPIDPAVVSSTIIDGGGVATCVRFWTNEGAASVLTGFFITGGHGSNEDGGGMYVYAATPTVTHCTFHGNENSQYGAAVSCYSAFGITLTNCTFSENSTTIGGGGGAIWLVGSVTLTNCAFIDNSANQGGAIYVDCGIVHANSCTFVGNEAADDFKGHVFYGSPDPICGAAADLTNCVVWGNGSEPPYIFAAIDVSAFDSLLQFDVPGEGNIIADPMFVDPANGDYRLQPGSPAIDAADIDWLPADEFDVDGDGDVDELLPLDLDGNPRVTGATLDMGAYEFDLCSDPTVDCCPADTDGSGAVDVTDLVNVVVAWGSDEPTADVNADGIVDVQDLVEVIVAWGACD